MARIFSLLFYFVYEGKQYKTGIQLPLGTHIGGGLAFIHYSSIVIAFTSKIGNDCTILQGVTIGHSFSAKNDGTPHIGNNVVIFAGAKVLGNITIGDKSVIAANSVVLSDVPENCIVAGQPATIISRDTSRLFGEQKWKNHYARYFENEL